MDLVIDRQCSFVHLPTLVTKMGGAVSGKTFIYDSVAVGILDNKN